jgi:hypothetical protein
MGMKLSKKIDAIRAEEGIPEDKPPGVAFDGYTTFLGQTMQQCQGAVLAISEFIEKVKPARILEIGTGCGGLSVFLKIACNEFRTYDNIDRRKDNEVFRALRINWRCEDIYKHLDEIQEFIQRPGLTLVMADGGNDKVKDFQVLQELLKPGDVIASHDFSDDPEGWPYSQITEEAIGPGLEKYEFDLMKSIYWLSCRKKQ